MKRGEKDKYFLIEINDFFAMERWHCDCKKLTKKGYSLSGKNNPILPIAIITGFLDEKILFFGEKIFLL